MGFILNPMIVGYRHCNATSSKVKVGEDMATTADIEILRVRDVAIETKSDTRTVMSWIKAGHLPAKKLPGGHWRVWRSDLVAFLTPDNAEVDSGNDA